MFSLNIEIKDNNIKYSFIEEKYNSIIKEIDNNIKIDNNVNINFFDEKIKRLNNYNFNINDNLFLTYLIILKKNGRKNLEKERTKIIEEIQKKDKNKFNMNPEILKLSFIDNILNLNIIGTIIYDFTILKKYGFGGIIDDIIDLYIFVKSKYKVYIKK